jgi:hypothetical protein
MSPSSILLKGGSPALCRGGDPLRQSDEDEEEEVFDEEEDSLRQASGGVVGVVGRVVGGEGEVSGETLGGCLQSVITLGERTMVAVIWMVLRSCDEELLQL